MEQAKIDRINALARKAKSEGLTAEETAERDALRQEYVASVRENLQGHLERTYYIDEQGTRVKLKKKEK